MAMSDIQALDARRRWIIRITISIGIASTVAVLAWHLLDERLRYAYENGVTYPDTLNMIGLITCLVPALAIGFLAAFNHIFHALMILWLTANLVSFKMDYSKEEFLFVAVLYFANIAISGLAGWGGVRYGHSKLAMFYTGFVILVCLMEPCFLIIYEVGTQYFRSILSDYLGKPPIGGLVYLGICLGSYLLVRTITLRRRRSIQPNSGSATG